MTPGRARASSLILIALIIGLSAIRAYPFLSGVLLTADEITWHLKVIQGTDRLDFWALREAMASGRIGQVFNRPLQYLTAAAHEHLAARIVFIAGWFATLALFARYVERVVGVTTPGLLFIVLVAMLPLEYDHLPPTSFPTLITVPAIGLLLLRFHLHGRYLLSATPPGFGTVLLLLPIMWVLVIFNELQTAFAISLAVFTYAVLAARQCAHMSELKRFFAQHRRIIGFEVMSLAVPITVYSAWRLAFPSGYDGIIVGGTVAAGVASVGISRRRRA